MYRVLIVEDEKFGRMLLKDILDEYFPYIEVLEAEDGEVAINMIKRDKPHIVILDIKLPKISGDNVCKLIKREKELENTKILLLTGVVYDKGNEVYNYIDGYINKPYHEEELVDKITQLLGEENKC